MDSYEDGRTIPGVEEKIMQNYKKKKTAPVFEGHLAKQANYWDAFKDYKESQDAKDLSEKNKKNA